MKYIFFLAGFASLLLACNSNSRSNTDNYHSQNEAYHHESDSNSNNSRNPIMEVMDRMMQQMHQQKSTGNIGVDFATMMIQHHKGAVEMSKVEVDKGSDKELISFAEKLINDQNTEIGFMEDFISKAPTNKKNDSTGFHKELQHSMMAMMADDIKVYNDINKDYAAQMIPHHQSAIDMAKVYLKYGDDITLKGICQKIISSQSGEITLLSNWLEKNK